jgi:hypothetical protein
VASIGYGVQETGTLFGLTLGAFGSLFASLFGGGTAPAGGGFVGVVGMGQLTGEVVRTSGLTGYLNWVGLISVNLALFKLIADPALDGSRICLRWWNGCGVASACTRKRSFGACGWHGDAAGLDGAGHVSDIRNLLEGRNPLGG